MSDSELDLDIERLSPRAMVALATRSSMRAVALQIDRFPDPPDRLVILAHNSHLLGLFVSTRSDPLPIAWARELYESLQNDDFFELTGTRSLLEAILALIERRLTDCLYAVQRTLSRASAAFATVDDSEINGIYIGATQADYRRLLPSGPLVTRLFFDRPLLPVPQLDQAWHAAVARYVEHSLIDPADPRFRWQALARFVMFHEEGPPTSSALHEPPASASPMLPGGLPPGRLSSRDQPAGSLAPGGGSDGAGAAASPRGDKAAEAASPGSGDEVAETAAPATWGEGAAAAPPGRWSGGAGAPAPARRGGARASPEQPRAAEVAAAPPPRTGGGGAGGPSTARRVGRSFARTLGGLLRPQVLSAPPRSVPARAADRSRTDVVNTGFAPASSTKSLSPGRALWPARRYCFWLEVGALDDDSMETAPGPLPVKHLPEGATLSVALFAFPRGIAVMPGADIGRIAVQPDGGARVICQPGGEHRYWQPPGDLGNRLYFPVRTPLRFGEAKLRCNIYYEQVLVQSRLVTARIRPWPSRAAHALASTLEYSLSRSLAPEGLRGISPHVLSVMLNDDGTRNTTHQFRFFGAKDFKADAILGEGELDDIIRQARAVMRRVAWGSDAEWQQQAYKYESPAALQQLSVDLISLARTGYRLYRKILPRLAQGHSAQDDLEALMAVPGRVQFASKNDVRQYLPASLIYDYPLDTNEQSTICPLFLQALERREPLPNTACFRGRCPSKGSDRIVCPSGFWGFRHDVSFPLSAAANVPTVLSAAVEPNFLMAISTTLDQAVAHREKIHALRQYRIWQQTDRRQTTLDLLRDKGLNVVYFYCHGGLDETVPFIQVGPGNEPGITFDNFGNKRIFWNQPGPLVFINGCRTTALQPSVAFDLVTSLIQDSQAAGVIGTEITVFEPLARTFAESFFRAFLVDAQTLGAAIRRARLSLLEAHNPLGLVYVPFALGSISLTTPAAAPGIAPAPPTQPVAV